MKRIAPLLIAATCLSIPLTGHSQALWASAKAKMDSTKASTAYVELEARTADGFQGMSRYSFSVGGDYKALPFLKLHLGYTLMDDYSPRSVTSKGNIVAGYWNIKNHVFGGVQGSLKIGHVSLSLREQYRLIHRAHREVPKTAADGITPKPDEIVEAKTSHQLRTRLQAEWKIAKKCPFTPEASVELMNSLNKNFSIIRWRFTAGCDWKINKHNILSLSYRYILNSDREDDWYNGKNIIMAGYTYRFKL